MASQSKKNKPASKKTPTSKKSINKKTVNKKRTRKRSKKTSNIKRNILILLALFLMISLISFGYFLGQDSNHTIKPKVVHNHKHKKVVTTHKRVQKKRTIVKNSVKKELLKKVEKVKKLEKTKNIEKINRVEKIIDKKKFQEDIAPDKKTVSLNYRSKRARLVIIIDDVHTREQLNAIKALNMKITPSIFPPYKLAPNSHYLARGLKHYMVHLPMESGSAKFNKQYKTLKTHFTKKRIKARVKEIRILFPTAKYINNHTGSVFTANYRSMYALYKSLKDEGFIFIDSMTTGSSKVKKIAHSFGDAYVARDIFIDNVHTVTAIHKQLRQAVKLAKKNGYAVVIGHPHRSTIKALLSAKSIFKDVDLVYIDEIYR